MSVEKKENLWQQDLNDNKDSPGNENSFDPETFIEGLSNRLRKIFPDDFNADFNRIDPEIREIIQEWEDELGL